MVLLLGKDVNEYCVVPSIPVLRWWMKKTNMRITVEVRQIPQALWTTVRKALSQADTAW